MCQGRALQAEKAARRAGKGAPCGCFLWEGGAACFFCAPLTQPVVPRSAPGNGVKGRMEKESGGVFRGVFGKFRGRFRGKIPTFFPVVPGAWAAPFCTFSGPFSGECRARSDVFHEGSGCLTGKGRRPCVREGRYRWKKRATGKNAQPEAADGMVVSFPLTRRPGGCRDGVGLRERVRKDTLTLR